ncbi:MAG: hypothetical protein EOP09_06830, partial [Proteobacteria bacterium]
MAAGLGTRLAPFTDVLPKPLCPIMGVPSIQFTFDLLAQYGVEKTVVNLHHHAEQLRNQLQFLKGKLDLEFSDETRCLLGSGGGVRKAKDLIGKEPFYLMNADTISVVHLKDLSQVHFELRHQYGVEITLVCHSHAPRGGKYREIILNRNGQLVSSLGDIKENSTFYTGVAIIHPEAIPDSIPLDRSTDFIKEILDPAIKRGRVGVYMLDTEIERDPMRWFDIGSPKLWWETHLRWIEMLEDDEFPTTLRNRVLKRARKLKPGVWTDVAEVSQSFVDRSQAPSFYGSLAMWESLCAHFMLSRFSTTLTLLYNRQSQE